MKMFTCLLLTVFAVVSAAALDLDPRFVTAIYRVESSSRPGQVGDHGRAIGPFQIHYQYWHDSGVKGRWQQCMDYGYALRVMTAYLNRYAAQAVGKRDYQVLARVHNGGPEGPLRSATVAYWRRVKAALP